MGAERPGPISPQPPSAEGVRLDSGNSRESRFARSLGGEVRRRTGRPAIRKSHRNSEETALWIDESRLPCWVFSPLFLPLLGVFLSINFRPRYCDVYSSKASYVAIYWLMF